MDQACAPPGEVTRRTFEAARWPAGSPERARLNEDATTSEYRRSYRYLAADGTPFRTRTLAQAYVDGQPRCGECGQIRFARIHVRSGSGEFTGAGHSFAPAADDDADDHEGCVCAECFRRVNGFYPDADPSRRAVAGHDAYPDPRDTEMDGFSAREAAEHQADTDTPTMTRR
jgi:hypothetical protein